MSKTEVQVKKELTVTLRQRWLLSPREVEGQWEMGAARGLVRSAALMGGVGKRV